MHWFPLRGLVSDNWALLSWPARILDYFWHIALPVVALVVGGFASLTMLTKNSFLDEINKQYVVTARAKGLTRAPRALRPRLPQRHADRDRRLPGRLHRHPLHRRAADRGDLLARRPRAARLRGGDQPRLPDHVRHALHLHADRPAPEPRQRPDLHARRSAHRLRAREALRAQAVRRPADSPPPAAANFRAEPARLLVAVDLPGPVRRHASSPSSSPTTGRCSSATTAASTSRCCARYPETTFGGDSPTAADYRDPAVRRADRGEGLDGLAADPVQLRHDHYDLPGPAPAPPSASTGSAPTTRAATCWRG